MEQRKNTRDVAMKDAQILLSEEEYALSMVQRPKDAAAKDA